jgi:hypothetical protein
VGTPATKQLSRLWHADYADASQRRFSQIFDIGNFFNKIAQTFASVLNAGIHHCCYNQFPNHVVRKFNTIKKSAKICVAQHLRNLRANHHVNNLSNFHPLNLDTLV